MNLLLLEQRIYLSRKELAEAFDVTPATVRRWEKNYGLRSQRAGKGRVYSTAEVKEWLKTRAA